MSLDLKSQLAAANTLYRQGDFAEAEQLYWEIRARQPENTSALIRLGELALWRNRPAEAERFLQEALTHASRLEKTWPFNMQLKSLLAMTCYRCDNFSQAARFFREAAGPVAIPPLNDLKVMGKQLALFGDDMPYRIEGEGTTSIPFIITDPLPVVEASINGSDPLLFLIDTGGAELILDTDLAKQLGAQFAGTVSGAGGGSKGRLGLGKVDSVRLGDISIYQVPIHTLDTQSFAASFELPIKGIIGTRLLMHFQATIDYPHARLILRSKTAPLEVKNTHAVPFYLVQTHYIIAQGTLNGAKPMFFFVDTGLGGQAFSASEATLRELGITVDWSKAETGVAGFGDTRTAVITAERLALGTDADQVVAHNLSGVVFKNPLEVLGYRLGFYIGGLVSHLLFRDYALTLDFVGMRLLLEAA